MRLPALLPGALPRGLPLHLAATGRAYHAGRHKFVDRVRLEAIGGAGGKGIISFESIDNIKRRPIGGHGGVGGDVIIEASRSVRDLNFQTFVIRGHDGTPATGKGNNGKAGRPKRIMVPVGTVVKEVQRVFDYGGAGGPGEDDYAYVPADVLDEMAAGSSSAASASDGDDGSDSDDAVTPLRRALANGSDSDGASEYDDDDAVASGRGRGRGRLGGAAGGGRGRRGRGGGAAVDGSDDSDEPLDDSDGDDSDGGGWQVVGASPNVPPPLPPTRAQQHQQQQGRRASDGESAPPSAAAATGSGQRKVNKAGIPYTEGLTALADLDAHGQRFVAARGGQPGVGNKGSQLNYAEQVRGAASAHTRGCSGQVRALELELKSIADVGLVGFPNAGKSSLLGAVSKAKPKVAAYPFTTLHPTVGVMHFRDGHSLTCADIPGLIEGAHLDRGLGHEFLRHIERTRILVYVIDAAGASGGGGSGDPAADLRALQHELRMYDPDLPRRPSIVVAHKADLPRARDGAARLRAATSLPVLEASSLTRGGVGAVVDALRWLLDASERQAAAQAAAVLQAVTHDAAATAAARTRS
jgi:Obg family GTPase CgtA